MPDGEPEPVFRRGNVSTVHRNPRGDRSVKVIASSQVARRDAFTGTLGTTLTLPMAALSLYLFVVHSYRLPLGWVGALAGLIGVLLQRRVRFPAPLLWVGAYLIWATLTALQSPYPNEVQTNLIAFSKVWLIFLIGINAPRTKPQWNYLLLIWLALYALFPIRGILFNFVAGITTAGRYSWNFAWENPNDFALITLPMLGLCVAILHGTPPKWARAGAVGGAIILPMSIMLTQSRGGILALATVGTMLFLQHRRRAQTMILVLIAIGTLAVTAPVAVWSRMTKLASADTSNLGELDSSAEQRFEIWKIAAAVSRDNILFGVGFGAYANANAAYARTRKFGSLARGHRSAHNSYLTLLAETGVVGLFLFIAFLVSLFRMALTRARELDEGDPSTARQLRVLLVGILGFLQAAIFGSVFDTAFLFLHAALIISLANVSQPSAGRLEVGNSYRRRRRPVYQGRAASPRLQ